MGGFLVTTAVVREYAAEGYRTLHLTPVRGVLVFTEIIKRRSEKHNITIPPTTTVRLQNEGKEYF